MSNHIGYDVHKPTFTNVTCPEYMKRGTTSYTTMPLDSYAALRNGVNPTLTSLLSRLPDDAYIAGSYIANMVDPTAPSNDIDIFFGNNNAFCQTLELLTDPPDDQSAWAWRGYVRDDPPGFDAPNDIMSMRVVTFKSETGDAPNIQLIKLMWFDDVSHVIDTFDFTVCQLAVYKSCGVDMLTAGHTSMSDVFSRRLIVHKLSYPMDMMCRIIKYTKKGYDMHSTSIANVVKWINEADDISSGRPHGHY